MSPDLTALIEEAKQCPTPVDAARILFGGIAQLIRNRQYDNRALKRLAQDLDDERQVFAEALAVKTPEKSEKKPVSPSEGVRP